MSAKEAADRAGAGVGRESGAADVDPEEAGLTLRERKKRRTRQRISGEATRLFIERGFEQVTVAEVARAAEVSAMTVFNYFPRKEDLFLDRVPEVAEMLVRAVRDRGPGEVPLAALRRLATGLVASGHPLTKVGEGFGNFWRTVLDSPALRARGREVLEELEELLAAELGRATGAAPGDPEPRLAAALIVAGWRAAYATAARRQLDGDPAEVVAVEQAAVLERTFDALERALPVLGRERRPG
ncbi:TetR/AcrR family transcriptional regulator [Streptomyces benahoarensis]|uniref:TetR family transcriptional regulator n=1 Tax=Streptomyces benahoarensis TaxID=2595054 RepID=A0A553ZRB1_9ACTN|nr:TetR/AcrR family transcriptional regulator [Streptomyces benahoarensis]TSB32387.1 TetR family transcriptional regulator [Streptomyces benahoarensis]TSB44000.1 TetR family transcriptional regulator [Streptomyces benahoarensis]